MKRLIALSTATLMGATLLASPVFAQADVNADVGVDVGGSADTGDTSATGNAGAGVDMEADSGTDVDTGTTAAVDGSFEGALSAIGNGSNTAGSIDAMTEVASVNVIRIEELADVDMDALTQAETDNSAAIEDLRASLEGNAAVMSALEAQSVDPDSVVAASVAADGSLVVYVHEQS